MAYITLYEDRSAAQKCLEAIKLQSIYLDFILIIDNSKEQLITNILFENVAIHHYPNNIGISGGMKIALEWAVKENYDLLWTFDQDSIPHHDCLEVLLDAYQRLKGRYNELGIVAANPYDKRSQSTIAGASFNKDKFVHHKNHENLEFYECDAPITSGSLIDVNAARVADFPLVDLFIDGIDFDHGLKLRNKGFKNFIVTKAKLDHNYASPIQFNILGFKIVFQSYSALRYYYSCRNTTYLAINYAQSFYKATAFIHRIKTTILKIVAILICEQNSKIEKIYACLLGTYHGSIKKLGKTWK